MTSSESTPVADRVTPRWRVPTLRTADRVDLLLEQMTLEEKVAQLGSRWIGGALPDTEADTNRTVAPMQDVFAAGRALSLEEASRDGLGHLTRVFGSAPVTAADGAAELVRQQRVVLDASRLGIPALVHEECLTGFTTFGATVYPAAIAWGATFDPALVERMAAAIGRTWRPWACIKVSRRCWMWCGTTAGAASRRPWAKTPTSSRCSAPPTCGGCRAPASSPP